MELEDFQAAEPLQKLIDDITAAQAKIAAAGSVTSIAIVDAENKVLISSKELFALLGASYTSTAGTALSSISSGLSSAKSTAQSTFDALGT